MEPLRAAQRDQRPDRRQHRGHAGAGRRRAGRRHRRQGRGPGPRRRPAWTRVTATGQYDATQEILVRNRTVDGQVGYEILTPLLLADGSALLVDRGWVPPHPDGITVAPTFPAAPAGTVTVVGRVHLTESGAGAVDQRNGHWETRRVSVPAIAGKLPYPVLGAYVLADADTPGAQGLTAIEVGHENDWLNLGYAVQWWIFAAGALVGVAYLARKDLREQRAAAESGTGPDPEPAPNPPTPPRPPDPSPDRWRRAGLPSGADAGRDRTVSARTCAAPVSAGGSRCRARATAMVPV